MFVAFLNQTVSLGIVAWLALVAVTLVVLTSIIGIADKDLPKWLVIVYNFLGHVYLAFLGVIFGHSECVTETE